MPLPLIPVVAGGVAIAGGLAAAGRGIQQHIIANREWTDVTNAHKSALDELERIRAQTSATVTDYGKLQMAVQEQTIGRFVHWLERHEQLVRRLDGHVVDGIELNIPELKALKFDLTQATGSASGFASAGIAGLSAQAAALWGVGSLASAGTGAAISSLSGIAAQNATLAWLGGGTLAAGGAGVAGGTVVLAFIAAAPAALIAGSTLAWSGSRRRKRTRQRAAEAEVQITSMQAAGDLTLRIGERISELRGVLTATTERTENALAVLELLDFDPEAHGPQLLRVYTLVRALREIINVRVIADDGELTDESIEIVMRYK
ncbi:hypothetical protein FHE66_14635 [Georgenia sp. 311]|uniref:hypothetical protein n=1 Tax=Georgenia sp. 311 TaxID=2585134 RepID=UPI0011128548|nr:hypothetical protein [Georgenia sp. 311]TNC16610.1 hypothetical protein FHE66_14635 [Georgenia sp. 311]